MRCPDNLDLFPEDIPAGLPIDFSPQSVLQRDRLLEALRHGLLSTFDARDRLAIPHPGARIQELRDLGHVIETRRGIAADGTGTNHHGVAHYLLKSSPAPESETPSHPVACPTGPGERGAVDGE